MLNLFQHDTDFFIAPYRQLIKASGSVGANYIEANESLSKKNFFYRIKVCRKEAKESGYWIRLVELEEELNEEGASSFRNQ